MADMDHFARMASLAAHHIQHSDSDPAEHHDSPNVKRQADESPPQPRAKRNRYISIACNECKRRKIKCNGQAPCQRCGNLNLECVYAPNCCSAFKDSQEFRDMSAHIASLQDQVTSLYHDLSGLRTLLGHGPSAVQQHAHSTPSHNTSIDPSLQPGPYTSQPPSFPATQTAQASPGAPIAPISPHPNRRKSQSQHKQPSFRGPTSAEYSFGVARNSLQTMGITSPNEVAEEGGSGNAGLGTAEASPAVSPSSRNRAQLVQTYHADKDPIWQISQDEALRLCGVYEDEMGLMYPVLDMENVTAYARKLYRFVEAAHRAGLMQQAMPGADSIEDEDTNILKLVLATAMTVEGSGRSELGQRLFDFVQPAIDNLLLGSVGVKGIRILTMTAMYEFHRDNEGTSWRIIGLTARLCIELGLHRRETYEAMQDDRERSETILLFWAIYVLDRRWSFGTGMPFALQDSDIDSDLPRPEDRSPYLSAMIQYSAIGSKVWRTVATTPGATINTEEMSYLDYQVVNWHRNIPAHLRFEHPSHSDRLLTPAGSPPSRAAHRLRILLYLRANQMRILIYRPVLHSATSIMQHREHASTVVDVAKDTVRVLTHINQTSDLYRTQQVLFNAFLTSALAVLFLAVSHTPAVFAESVREEFYMALRLVRGFSKDSWIGKRLWKTIRILREVGPRLGLRDRSPRPPPPRPADVADDELDPSRSAAVAMAGLAGHNVDETALYPGDPPARWPLGPGSGASTSPDQMANELTSLFEAAGGLQALGESGVNGGGGAAPNGLDDSARGPEPPDGEPAAGLFGGDEGLANILKDLF